MRFVLSKVKASENIIVLYIYPFYMGISTDNFIMDNLENNGENHFITFCGYYYKPNERLYVCEGEYLGRYVCMENPHYPYKVSAVFDQMRKDVTETIYNRLRKEIPAGSVELPSETDQNCLARRVFFSEKEPTLSVKKVMSYFLECCNMDNLERWLANPTKWENDEAERLLSNHEKNLVICGTSSMKSILSPKIRRPSLLQSTARNSKGLSVMTPVDFTRFIPLVRTAG